MEKFKPGDRVTYVEPIRGTKERGFVKSLSHRPSAVYVVYNTSAKWRYYSAQLTNVSHLVKGWKKVAQPSPLAQEIEHVDRVLAASREILLRIANEQAAELRRQLAEIEAVFKTLNKIKL